jgi:cytochrome c5
VPPGNRRTARIRYSHGSFHRSRKVVPMAPVVSPFSQSPVAPFPQPPSPRAASPAVRPPWRRARALAAAALALAALPGAALAAERSGQEVYDAVCAACHATGVLNAPKLGDAKAWKPLIAEGQRALVRAAIKGIRQMPPRGGRADLTDREVERAVVLMANSAGGKFREPK